MIGEPIGQSQTQYLRWQELMEVPESVRWGEQVQAPEGQPMQVPEQGHIQSTAWEKQKDAVQDPDEDSRAIDSRFASTPDRKECENTSDQCPVPHLRPRGPFQMSPDAETDQGHLRR